MGVSRSRKKEIIRHEKHLANVLDYVCRQRFSSSIRKQSE